MHFVNFSREFSCFVPWLLAPAEPFEPLLELPHAESRAHAAKAASSPASFRLAEGRLRSLLCVLVFWFTAGAPVVGDKLSRP
jgi:hypothetical protein